jgi:predicted Zn finger-like uncharacterized protein
MLITCRNCETSYEITAASLGPAGRSVRCVRCQHVWFAANTETLASVATAHRTEINEFSAGTSVAGLAGLQPPQVPPDDIAVAEAPRMPASEHVVPAEGSNLDGPTPAPAVLDATPVPAADLAVVNDAPPLAPIVNGGPKKEPPPLEDIETVAARRARRLAEQQRGRFRRSMGTAILALIAVNIGLLGWRTDIVRWLPQTASLYAALGFPVNLRGLVFHDVKTEMETQDSVAVLVVEGTIANITSRAVDVPRLRFALRNASGQEIHSWTALPTKDVLVPGETLPFRSRLASPPRDGSQVVVRFFTRRDLVAGLK